MSRDLHIALQSMSPLERTPMSHELPSDLSLGGGGSARSRSSACFAELPTAAPAVEWLFSLLLAELPPAIKAKESTFVALGNETDETVGPQPKAISDLCPVQ